MQSQLINRQSSVKDQGIVQSTCAYCGVGCGVDITLSQGKASTLKGTPEHPANFGRLCVKGTHLLETIDLTDRLLVPLVNDNEVCWQDAIDTVATKFKGIINEHGPDAVAFYVSGQMLTEDYYVANKLMKGFIGSGNIDTNSRLCMSSAVSAYKRAFGEDIVPCSYTDLENTDLLVLTGSNAAWTHPVLFQRIERAKQINPNFKVVVVDPRVSATAATADLHLPIKPGTDTALFNGLLNYLLEHDGLDNEYIRQSTEGFTNCMSECSAWTLDKVSNFCAIETKILIQFYQCFLASDKVVTMYSMGINQSTSGVDKCQSIINVHLATGKIGKEGCGPFSITGQPNAMGGREVGGLANQLAAHMEIENEQHRDLVQTFWQSPCIAEKQGAKAVDLFDQIHSGKIKAIWIMATNPLVSLPDNAKIIQAMEQCEFVVVSDCVSSNDTLEFADVKLPATPWIEKNGTVTNSERRISRQRNSLMPAGQAKHDWEIISLVAQAMGYKGFDYNHPQQVFTEFASLSGYKNEGDNSRIFDISGLSALTENQYDLMQPVQWPINEKYPLGCKQLFANGEYATSSAKASFIAVTPKLPEQQINDTYPLSLNSGRYRDQWHTMTRTGKAAKLTQHLAKPFLSINPLDAKKANIENGDIVTVRSKVGEIIAPANITDEQTSGQCFMPIHWNKKFASNATISALYQSNVDPISGQPEAKYTGISVEKLSLAQYGDIFVSDEFAVNADYWLKTKTTFGWHYQMAHAEEKTVSQWTALFGLNGEWLSFENGNTKQLICLVNNKLVCAIYLSAERFSEPLWISEYFSKETVSFADIQLLLSGAAPSREQTSRKVCSCFNVSEYQIEQAIEQGCSSVTELGEQLKCGTNCGSCKPELQSIINSFDAEANDIIPIVEVVNG
ncbi:molybdopterin-dependent oxidoreductase [Thalassotalea sp. M1531]|uniref:Molybdopterin-dependent oxidoreductase n=2 Tax=Thalassotalea algicola TaxID=2716224 RepID=A0A7Y0Q7I8_9GAMM|nr:molybdopterin-dependent oxidoreductase [Thalassotalea algicola]